MALDFYPIQTDLQALLRAATYTVPLADENILIEAMERDVSFDRMPLVNIRYADPSANIEARAAQGYYALIFIEIDLFHYDFDNLSTAAQQRDTLLKEILNVIRGTPKFNSTLNTSRIGESIRLGVGTPEQAGGHVATATIGVLAEAYIDEL